MFRYILATLVGYFLGILTMSLCVICRERKRPDSLEACKVLVRFCESKERLDDDGVCPTQAYELAKAAIAKAKKEG